MKCPKCGAETGGASRCPRCGASMEYGGNTVFYGKAAGATLTLKDVFSDVFKHHSKADGERIFLAGTSQSTPSEQEMLAQWKKPWLFLRVAVIGIVLAIGMYFMVSFGVSNALPGYYILAAGTLPLAVLVFFWEMNIPRNIPIYEVVLMLFAGGILSLFLTVVLDLVIPDPGTFGDSFAAFIEEPAKILALALFLRKPQKKYILNGILIGAAIGAGFALFESAGYVMGLSIKPIDAQHWTVVNDKLISVTLKRGFGNLGGHALYAGIEGGALAMVKGSAPLKVKHFFSGDFLKFTAASVACHFLNNADWFPSISIGALDLSRLLLNLLLWVVMLRLLQKGIRQVLAASSAAGPAKMPASAAPAAAAGSCTVSGVAGLYRGQTIPVEDGNLVFGRDPKTCNLIFPASTAGISRLHCILKKRDGELLLTDCNSSCGTFLENGTRLVPGAETRLELGQRFYLGNQETMFEVTLGASRYGL